MAYDFFLILTKDSREFFHQMPDEKFLIHHVFIKFLEHENINKSSSYVIYIQYIQIKKPSPRKKLATKRSRQL